MIKPSDQCSSADAKTDVAAETDNARFIPFHFKVMCSWMLGLLLGMLWSPRIVPVIGVCFFLLVLQRTRLLQSRQTSPSQTLTSNFARDAVILTMVMVVGIWRWEVWEEPSRHLFHEDREQVVAEFLGRIDSVPTVYQKPKSEWDHNSGSPERTSFRFYVKQTTGGQAEAIDEDWNVSIDGSLRGEFSCGDEVRIEGLARSPASPSNPGQFDFRNFLIGRGITRQLFVSQRHAVRLVKPAAWWSPMKWASWLRADAERILSTELKGRNRQIAVAMFLGERSQLSYELQDSFVASGTMHLLAISGLHVGVLSILILRLFRILGVKRSTALWGMMMLVCGYAMVTGFRPPVVRATVFLLFFGFSELLGRRQTLFDLLSLTALLMTIAFPFLLTDSGAWLSFLAVSALSWLSSGNKAPIEIREAPEDQQSVGQIAKGTLKKLLRHLASRQRQMLAILMFTVPLTMTVFHVLSPVGLIVNVLLISFTFVVLLVGYGTLLIGILIPGLASYPAALFSKVLSLFIDIVCWASEIRLGHLYLSDFPGWFLPCWYGALAAAVLTRSKQLRRASVGFLFVVAFGGMKASLTEPVDRPLTVTVLDIGKGSAAVIEDGGRVTLVDAGSSGKDRLAGEIISGFLWSRGWHHVDQIVISHADVDHYNAVPTLISRFPVNRVLTSQQFMDSSDPGVAAFLKLTQRLNIPIGIADSLPNPFPNDSSLKMLQPSGMNLHDGLTDNESSLVVQVNLGESSVLLPGDLEGQGMQQLLSHLENADVLVSPHHGSRFSNSPELAASVKPKLVIASNSDSSTRPILENVFADARTVWWTCETGAASFQMDESSIQATRFLFEKPIAISTVGE